MEVYAHGLNHSIEFGYMCGDVSEQCSLNMNNISIISSNAFDGLNSHISSFACRTGLGSDSYIWGVFTYRDKSLAQAIANTSQANVHAYAVRTDYQFTLGTWSERRFDFPNNAPQIKMIDGAAFTPKGAAHPVQNGNTPIGVYSGFMNFRPSK